MLGRLFRFFAASLVPGDGYFVGGWSPATALTLYWVDNVRGGVAMSIRILLHRRATGAAGWAMNLFPRQNGESFDEFWRRTRRTEEEKAALDEEVVSNKR